MTQVKSKRPRIRALEIAFGILFLFTGFFAGLFTNYHLNFKFQFRDTIEPAAFLSTLCTVILAFIVGIIWNRRQYAENSSKEILVKRLEEMQEFSADFSVRAGGDSFFWTDATSGIKRLRTGLSSVGRLADEIHLSLENAFRLEVDAKIEKLDDLITNTPAFWPAGKPSPVTVTNNKIIFSKERGLEVAMAFEDLRHSITAFELAINRA